MKCKMCGAKIKKKSESCEACGTKVTHIGRRVVTVILAFVILLASVGFAGWKFGLRPFEIAVSTGGFSFLTGTFTDRKITDRHSALAAIGDVADELGIQDVNAEFSSCKEDTVSGNTYYRFYQEYDGIPVYGGSIVVAADSNDDALSLSGNYAKVESVSTNPTVSLDTIQASIIEYANGKIYSSVSSCGIMSFDSEDLIIYQVDDTTSVLAYNLLVSINGEAYRFIVDANDASVYEKFPLAINKTVTTTYSVGKGKDKKKKEVNLWKENGEYSLYDRERNIKLFTANGETLVHIIVCSNENGEKWTYNLHDEKWRDEDGNEVSRPTDPSIYVESYIFDTKEKQYGVFPVTSSTLNFDDDAVQMMVWVEEISDFYNKELERNGWSGTYDNELRVVYNCNNGSYSYTDGNYSMLSLNSKTTLDTVAHEFTHSVEQSISGMKYSGESGALMEAYSDIFGEIIEEWETGKDCDWIHNGGKRNIISPEKSTESNMPHPSSYKDYYWYDTEDDGDNGGVHINSTVISHAAYLMYNGISGSNPIFEALTTEDLAHLFYETLYTLPSNCTFSQFRSLIQNTAEIMNQQNRLSYKKTRCVYNAFFQVGIDSAAMPVSKDNLTLDIYGVDGQIYDDYTLYVRHSSGAEKKYSAEEVTGNGIFFPKTGIYELYIEDNANILNYTSISVNVMAQGGITKLPIFTQCGLSSVGGLITAPSPDSITPLDAYLEAAEKTTATGNWTENVDMTADMIIEDGSSTTKTKATMKASVDVEGWNGTDTSSLYMSGAASMSVLNQSFAYTMTWQNGMAHYEYTEPLVTSADIQADPSYFNFYTLTEDMISSSHMNGNQITFTVMGDALTRVGIEAVNSLISDVENLSYDDADVVVTIDEETGKLDKLTMNFRASMTYQGYDLKADYDIHYTFTEHDKQSSSQAVVDIPAGALYWNGHYYACFDNCYSWEEAARYCESLGGYLATINSSDENDVVFRYLLSCGHENGYFGYTDNNEEGSWYWINGEASSYTNWHSGEPNGESSNEDYAMFYYKFNDGTWNDGNFGQGTTKDDKVFICEWDSNDNIKNTSYLEELPYSTWDRYTGNEGDSFIDKVGTRNSRIDINGTDYSHGLECWVARWNYTNETSWVWKEWELHGNYDIIQGEITVSSSCYNQTNYKTIVEIIGDGKTLCTYTLSPKTKYPIVFLVDISSVNTLRISLRDDGSFSGGTSIILGNVILR